jgi:hypothetical protein
MAVLGVLACSAAAASARTEVHYRGYRIEVPSSWPVYHLSPASHVCVRFDRHAIYLGPPPAAQHCPAHAVGRTEAVLIQPLGARAAGAGAPLGPALSGGGAVSHFSAAHGRVLVTATWGNAPGLVRHALGVPRLDGSRAAAAVASPAAAPIARAAPERATAHTSGVYTGLGFDACATPSSSQMAAWGSSPYRAVGVYIGGENRACAQANLTSAWVSGETAAGWHVIPIYVGLQAPGACGCSSISSSRAAAQGAADANAAIADAQAIGLGAGNPIYDDMEGYAVGTANTSAVLAFLSAWTSTLHAAGYQSGVYSSADSGVRDLAARWGTGYLEPDDIWFARWNDSQSTSDSSLPAGEWANHQRLHQYLGDHAPTYGGVKLDIDGDYVDGATAGPSAVASIPDGTFVQVEGVQGVYRIAGGAPLWINDPTLYASSTIETISGAQFAALPQVPADGTFLGTPGGAYYRVAGGAPLAVSDWSVFGGVKPYVTIDQWDIDNITDPLAHLRPVPINGTFLTTTTGQIYRVAGGAPFRISRWSVFHHVLPSVTVDQWDIDNTANPAAHLLPRPVDGTVVLALPSHWYWSFAGGWRRLGGPSSQAVTVDDSGVGVFPGENPLPVPKCVAPKLRHLTFPKAKAAISKALCSLGKVGRPHHWGRHHKLRVYWQIPGAKRGFREGHRVGIKMR